jgi:hypothetical protein
MEEHWALMAQPLHWTQLQRLAQAQRSMNDLHLAWMQRSARSQHSVLTQHSTLQQWAHQNHKCMEDTSNQDHSLQEGHRGPHIQSRLTQRKLR